MPDTPPPGAAEPAATPRSDVAAAVFPGPGEIAARCRALDWAATPLGPVAAWPLRLRAAADHVLAAAFPVVLLWGPDLVQLYNDGYRALMGGKHPAGLGQPTRACWPEVWHLNAPIYARVSAGETVVLEDALFPITRSGVLENAWFTLSYSPVHDERGGVAGVLVTVFETTAQRHAQGVRERERERLLAESEAARAQLAATLESIGDGFYALDAGFRFTYVNGRAEALLGRPREALLGRDLWAEFPGAADTASHAHYHAAMADRRAAHFETRSAVDGRWLDVSVYPDAASGGLACYFRDADERKTAEAALRESEARFRLMADAVPQIVWITDAAGRVEFFNRQWTRYTGAPYEPTTAADVAASFVHPDDAAATMAAFAAARRTGDVFAVEHRIRSAAGDYRWFLVRAEPSRDPETGAVVRWFGASVDIHDRRQAEAALAASEARLRLALDVAELGTWAWDLVTGAGDLDARGAAIVGLPPGSLADVASAQFAAIHPDDLAATQAAAAAGVAGRTPFDLHYRVVTPDGGVRHVAARAVVVADGAGRPVRLAGTNRDVTAEHEAAAERERLLAAAEAARDAAERARGAAEAANAAKAQFVANMSHELRTPLNAIAGYVQLLDMGLHGPVTEAQRGALARVQGAQARLLALINDVLNYAKLESGRVDYDVRSVDVADVVRDVAPLVEPQLRAKGLTFDVRLPDAPCLVAADREKLGQVLVNLLSNAVKFTESPHAGTGAPGRVTVEVATRAVGDASAVPGGAADALAFLRVTDTGRGIPREKQDAIFEPFVQVRAGVGSAYADAIEGTGLGLAISRDLARGMGGDLRVRSAPGDGATFTVALRRVPREAGDAGTDAAVSPGGEATLSN